MLLSSLLLLVGVAGFFYSMHLLPASGQESEFFSSDVFKSLKGISQRILIGISVAFLLIWFLLNFETAISFMLGSLGSLVVGALSRKFRGAEPESQSNLTPILVASCAAILLGALVAGMSLADLEFADIAVALCGAVVGSGVSNLLIGLAAHEALVSDDFPPSFSIDRGKALQSLYAAMDQFDSLVCAVTAVLISAASIGVAEHQMSSSLAALPLTLFIAGCISTFTVSGLSKMLRARFISAIPADLKCATVGAVLITACTAIFAILFGSVTITHWVVATGGSIVAMLISWLRQRKALPGTETELKHTLHSLTPLFTVAAIAILASLCADNSEEMYFLALGALTFLLVIQFEVSKDGLIQILAGVAALAAFLSRNHWFSDWLGNSGTVAGILLGAAVTQIGISAAGLRTPGTGRNLILLGLTIAAPILIGFLFGPLVLAGVLIGELAVAAAAVTESVPEPHSQDQLGLILAHRGGLYAIIKLSPIVSVLVSTLL